MRIFTVPGKPLGKQRPRVLKTGITYTPAKTVNYENFVKQIYFVEHRDKKPLEGPVRMKIRAYLSIPKSTSKKKREAMMRGEIRPTKKPDWDNMGKIITDALNGIAYGDDKQVVSCLVEKFYSDMPRVQVEIGEEEPREILNHPC